MNESVSPLKRRHFLVGAAAVAGSAILAACGGSSNAPSTPSAAATTSAAPTTAPGATSAAPAGTASVASAAAAATKPAGLAVAAAPATGGAASTATSGTTAAGKIASQIDTKGIKKGGHLTESQTSDVQTFNPVLTHDTTSNLVINLIFNQLVYTDPDTLQPVPDLATKWDISPDGKTYTFTLRTDVKWHDGQPFTADDVKQTYDLLMNSKSGTTRASTLNADIASVVVKDPQTVVFTCKDVIAPFLVNDASYGIVPKHIFDSVPPESVPTHAFSTTKPVGTGPFMMKEYVQGDHITLVANPNYFKGAPALDQYIFKVVKDTNVTLQQLKTNEIDVGTVQAQLYDEAKKQTNFDTIPYDTFSYSILVFNLDPKRTPVFQDVNVRQALCYALDRPGIVAKIRNTLSTVGVGVEPILSWAYQPDKIAQKYPYDATKANQLLDQAGWVKGGDGIRAKGGTKLSFTLWTYTDVTTQAITAVMQENWKTVGADVAIQSEDFNIFVSRLAKTHDFDAFFEGFAYGVDPDITVRFDSTQFPNGLNYGAYNNAQVTTLLDQALHVLDRDKRLDLYVQAQNLIAADAPVLVTDFPKSIQGVNKRVKNFFPNDVSRSSRFDAHLWYVTDGK